MQDMAISPLLIIALAFAILIIIMAVKGFKIVQQAENHGDRTLGPLSPHSGFGH